MITKIYPAYFKDKWHGISPAQFICGVSWLSEQLAVVPLNTINLLIVVKYKHYIF
jgi:hypothetical protein